MTGDYPSDCGPEARGSSWTMVSSHIHSLGKSHLFTWTSMSLAGGRKHGEDSSEKDHRDRTHALPADVLMISTALVWNVLSFLTTCLWAGVCVEDIIVRPIGFFNDVFNCTHLDDVVLFSTEGHTFRSYCRSVALSISEIHVSLYPSVFVGSCRARFFKPQNDCFVLVQFISLFSSDVNSPVKNRVVRI